MASDDDKVQSREKLAGVLLIAAAAAALLIANTGLADPYHSLLESRFGPALPRLGVLSVHEWIADGLMAMMNLLGVRRLLPYMIAFGALWLAMLASGVHATISGVLAALTIPLGSGEKQSPLKRLEHAIHPWVMLGIMPLFGLASAGVHIGGFRELLQPVPLAIIAGLFLGKQVGVFGSIWLMAWFGIATRKPSTPWIQVYGAALLTGVGFTMSLFIGALAFNDPELVDSARLGTIVGSLLSAVAGWSVLYFSEPFVAEEDRAEALEIFAGDFDDETQESV